MATVPEDDPKSIEATINQSNNNPKKVFLKGWSEVLTGGSKLNENSLLSIVKSMTDNIEHDSRTLDDDGDPSEENETEWRYAYYTHSTTRQVQIQVDAGRLTRNSRAKKTTKLSKTTTLWWRVQSPSGPHTYKVSCVDKGEPIPKEPYTVIRIKKEGINMGTETIDTKQAEAMTHEVMNNLPASEIYNLPAIRGKVALDRHKNLTIRIFELCKERRTNIYKWIPTNKYINFTKIGNHISTTELAKGDEVMGRLTTDDKGKPFISCITKASMLQPDNFIAGTKIEVVPKVFNCQLANQLIDTRATNSAFETPSSLCKEIGASLNSMLYGEKFINLIPSAGHSTMYADELNTITISEIDEQLERSFVNGELERKLMWYDLDMDGIHQIFLDMKSETQIAELRNKGYIDTEDKAHWVVHYTHTNVMPSVIQMVVNSYNKQTKTAFSLPRIAQPHAHIKSTSVITETQLKGRAGDILSETLCPQVCTRHNQLSGFNLPVMERDYTRLLNLYSARTKDNKMTMTKLSEINTALTIHTLRPDGHTKPTKVTHQGGRVEQIRVGTCMEYTLQYSPTNEEIKTLLKKLANIHVNETTKLLTIKYVKTANGSISDEVDQRYLDFGKYRKIIVTIQPGYVENTLSKLNEKGAFMGPRADYLCDDSNTFELTSKYYLPFPRELTEVQKKFKMIQILDRSRFRVHLLPHQKIEDVPDLLGFSKPSEHDSVCLSTKDGSPWTQINMNGMSVLLNNTYVETMPEKHNTVYLKGFPAMLDAEWIEGFILTFTEISTKIVNKIEDTVDGTILVRYLQSTNADSTNHEHHSDYVMAISSNDTVLIQNMKTKMECIYQSTGGELSYVTDGLQKLRLVAAVTRVEDNSKLDPKIVSSIIEDNTYDDDELNDSPEQPLPEKKKRR